ncbi:MAG: ribosome biogenesis factor YjgA [Steroidobacteraceae bacterium]|jgi:ribosome-associated protein|nr:ribosome biogenesis factor YjgA [Steroidobacteraceae bacterium]
MPSNKRIERTHESEGDDFERPSKSELKRRSSELQELGEALIELSDSELDALPLPDTLRDAVLLARRITKHGGLYRQKQYIGKLMRKIDAEPIRAAIEARRESERAATVRLRRIEAWRDRLIREGSDALEALRLEAPRIDAAHISRLIERARAERERRAAPAASRELFRLLRGAFEPKAARQD